MKEMASSTFEMQINMQQLNFFYSKLKIFYKNLKVKNISH